MKSWVGIGIMMANSVCAEERIVTLTPHLTEWAHEVLESEAEKKIVGATDYSDYPEQAKKISRVGPYPRVDLEKVIRLRPTHVMASSDLNDPQQIGRLKKLGKELGFFVTVLEKEDFREMPSWILKFAQHLGRKKKGLELSGYWQKEIERLKESKKRRIEKKVLVQLQSEPFIFSGKNTCLSQGFDQIGFQNALESGMHSASDYPRLSAEQAIRIKKDEILMVSLGDTQEQEMKRIQTFWKQWGTPVRFLSGHEFARCSFSFLKALLKFDQPEKKSQETK